MIGLGHRILRLRRTRVGVGPGPELVGEGGGHSTGKNDVAPGSD